LALEKEFSVAEINLNEGVLSRTSSQAKVAEPPRLDTKNSEEEKKSMRGRKSSSSILPDLEKDEKKGGISTNTLNGLSMTKS